MVSSTKAQSVNYRSKTELCYGHEEKAETLSHLVKLLRSLGIVGILSKFAIAFYKMLYFAIFWRKNSLKVTINAETASF